MIGVGERGCDRRGGSEGVTPGGRVREEEEPLRRGRGGEHQAALAVAGVSLAGRESGQAVVGMPSASWILFASLSDGVRSPLTS